MKFPTARKGTKTPKLKAPRKKTGVTPSKKFVKAVQSIIHKDVETKQAYNFIQDVAYNSSINSAADCQVLIANISQGTADNARIGDQIRAQKLTIKGFINSRFSYGTNTYYQACRIGVRLMIVQPKAYSGLQTILSNASTWQATLLKKGGTTSGFTGQQSDLFADINTDAITQYYNKVFYIAQPWANTTIGGATAAPLIPVDTVRFFKHTINLKNKLLKYDNSVDSGLTPVNYNPIVLLGYCLLDGSADVTNTAVALSYDSYLYYEDA